MDYSTFANMLAKVISTRMQGDAVRKGFLPLHETKIEGHEPQRGGLVNNENSQVRSEYEKRTRNLLVLAIEW